MLHGEPLYFFVVRLRAEPVVDASNRSNGGK